MKNRPTPFHALTAMQKCKRLVVAVVGGTVLVIGLALVVLPGPAFIVIPAGLAILAMEFAWARRWLRKAKGLVSGTNRQRKHERPPSSSSTNYRRAKATASFRKAISGTKTETSHQPQTHC